MAICLLMYKGPQIITNLPDPFFMYIKYLVDFIEAERWPLAKGRLVIWGEKRVRKLGDRHALKRVCPVPLTKFKCTSSDYWYRTVPKKSKKIFHASLHSSSTNRQMRPDISRISYPPIGLWSVCKRRFSTAS